MPSKFYNLDTDPTLSANSDVYIPSQKAVKTAIDKKQDILNADNTTIEISSTNEISVSKTLTNRIDNIETNIGILTNSLDNINGEVI